VICKDRNVISVTKDANTTVLTAWCQSVNSLK
jgi:hypothetical protein